MRSAFQIRLREGGSRVGLLAGTMFAAVMAMGVMPGPAAADPPTAISLALSSPTVVADGASTVTAIATLTGDTTGNEPVTIISDKGDETVSAVTHTGGATSGQYQATIKSSKALETATITAADNNIVALNVRSASKQLQQTLGPPATITLKLAPSTITAGSSTTETAEVLDAGQHPLDSQLVTITPGGSVTPGGGGSGSYSSSFTTSTAGQRQITASVGSISDQKTLTIDPAGAIVTVQTSPSSIVANGSSTSTVTATVQDAFGNRRTADTVTFSPAGRFGG